jgi:hypothetical protein
VDLQKKLSKKQLAQYQREEQMNMFSKSGNINVGGMTTRSASRAGLGFAPRVQTPMPMMETSFGGTSSAGSMTRNVATTNEVTSPRDSIMQRSSPSSNFITSSPTVSAQFGRSSLARFSLDNMDNSGGGANVTANMGPHTMMGLNQKLSMRQRIGSFFNNKRNQQQQPVEMQEISRPGAAGLVFSNPAYSGRFDGPSGEEHLSAAAASRLPLTARQRFQNIISAAQLNKRQRHMAKVGAKISAQIPPHIELHNEAFENVDAPKISARQRYRSTLKRLGNTRRQAGEDSAAPLLNVSYNARTGQVTLPAARGSMPRAEFMRYANAGRMEYPNILQAMRRQIQRHKRGLMIAGGVLAGAAIVGGILGGTLSKLKKRKKEMQHDSPVGVFERLSDSSGVSGGGGGGGGGGGTGGFGNYQRNVSFPTFQQKQAVTKRRRYKKKTKKQSSRNNNSKRKRASRGGGGRIVKRSRTVKRKGRRINKRAKKTRKSKHNKNKAF